MIFKVIYLIVLALLIALEHLTVGEKWPELVRRGMGVITVMGCSFCLVWFDVYESTLDCWLWTFFGFGLAGTVLIGMHTYQRTNTRQIVLNQIEALRNAEKNSE